MTDLIARMRTCAAWIIAHDSRAGGRSKVLAHVTLDAADLLIEASNILDIPLETRGKLRDARPLHPVAQKIDVDMTPGGTWIAAGDILPTSPRPHSRHACPKCDSRANKRVRRDGRKLMLTCPACAETWEYQPR